MDSDLTTTDVARLLGTTVPRVHRAVRAGSVACSVDPRGRLRFDADAVESLRQQWGYAPTIQGLSREQVFVFAALSRRPFGLSSARAVARAAGVSPTTAGRALRVLAASGCIERRTQRVAQGRARDVDVWTVRWGSAPWRAVASEVGRCVLPTPSGQPRERRVPKRLGHLFWNVDLDQLDTARDGWFIANRVLRSDDAQAIAWMAANVAPADIDQAARGRGLDPRRAALGHVLAGTRR
ncbi:MAG: MarR family transcriptional regulator [Egibacteraceae bacterium]